nr:immunoglobulin heavy chain junction region [Macaca mulatta]
CARRVWGGGLDVW